MDESDHEAERLAGELVTAKAEVDERRLADLERLRREEAERRERQGFRDGQQEAFNEDSRKHFAAINGSIEKSAVRLGALEIAVSLLPSQIREEVDVALAKLTKDAGDKTFSKWTLIFAGTVAVAVVATFLLGLYGLLHK